jgi:AcrR family transcriptional regulator
MTEEKRKLLKNITEIFFSEGFYKTTMDDLASELRVSKKTIYKYFPTKEYLINMVIHGLVFTVRSEFKKILSKDTTSVEKVVEISNVFISMASRVNVNKILEIKKLGPQFWSTIEKLRAKEITTNFGKLIVQGQKEGYIIPVPAEVILAVFISSIQTIITPDFILKHEFTFKQVGQMLLEIMFNGVLTKEGKIIFENLKTEKA